MKMTSPRTACASMRSLLASSLLLCSICLHAAPDEALDPVNRLLKERGLLSTDTSNEAPLGGLTSKPKKLPQSASELVISAMNFLGVRYQLGGDDFRSGFDCSGFTHYIYKNSLGLTLPRRVDEQASAPGLRSVERNDIKPGDLVFFNTLGRTFSHVGIYVGEGKFIHAPRTGSHVRIENLRTDYWSRHFTGARRAPSGLNESRVDVRPEPKSETRTEPRPEGNFISNFIPAYVPVDYSSDLYAH